jgi:hypothetical protein
MDYFLYPISKTETARVPFPHDVPLDKRAAYAAKPPAEALAKAERVATPATVAAPAAEPTPTEG